MNLKKYQKKRNFKQTIEPLGNQSADSGQSIFVIQKHDASSLHYDFRLEKDGVLKSWAIPKKPPQKAGIKRLAMETEDHPLEYAEFEGEIPEGEYGAGTVEIWDKGVYKDLSEKGWEEKEIKVKLKGSKLNGEYVLVHPSKFDKNQWLLFKTKK